MTDATSATTGPESATAGGATTGRELWGSRAGFILAAVGSAVGLGNMWRFAYQTAEGGGAAFVVLYLLLTFVIGIPVMIAEFGLGRSTRQSPIGALHEAGGRRWTPVGYLFVISGVLILAYYSVIAGWVTRYALDAILSPFPADSAGYFGRISQGIGAAAYHLIFMVATILIVSSGIKRGIERASYVMMPLLFAIMLGLAIWAAFLPGANEGYTFYLTPHVSDVFSFETLGAAASQAFFSLSLGMGAMLTYASYLQRNSNLPGHSTVIAISDMSVAFVAGLVVFPVIFALGLQSAVGSSALGTLFISLPGAFEAMGATGRAVGLLFFIALFVGALTSAISLLEVVVASAVDSFGLERRSAALICGGLIALIGIAPALDTNVLGAMDAVASEVFLPLGGLLLAILVGWRMKDRLDAFTEGASPALRPLMTAWIWTLRLAVPPLLVIVLWNTVPTGIAAVRTAIQGGN
ncbi:MAG: sodium-dependent transporter [Longimicrobiales bacterium]